jgi:hypothetical protein
MEATKGSSVELLIFEAPRAINVFLKVYCEIHYKLMILVGGEFAGVIAMQKDLKKSVFAHI